MFSSDSDLAESRADIDTCWFVLHFEDLHDLLLFDDHKMATITSHHQDVTITCTHLVENHIKLDLECTGLYFR